MNRSVGWRPGDLFVCFLNDLFVFGLFLIFVDFVCFLDVLIINLHQILLSCVWLVVISLQQVSEKHSLRVQPELEGPLEASIVSILTGKTYFFIFFPVQFTLFPAYGLVLSSRKLYCLPLTFLTS